MSKSTRKPTKRPIQDTEEEIKNKRRQAPGKTIQSRENQLINMAAELAEKQIRNGSASSQVITHFLKLGSTLAGLEKVKMENENLLLQAKAESLKSQKKIEELYANAVNAFKMYSGQETENNED
jgi:hypothetical protein